MSKQKSQKRPSSVVGMKSLIASAAVAATLAAWAVLPSNDPTFDTVSAQAVATVEATATSQPTTEVVNPAVTATQVPTTQPIQSLPILPSNTPVTGGVATATPTTAQPTATAIPTAIPTVKPAAITRSRSSR